MSNTTRTTASATSQQIAPQVRLDLPVPDFYDPKNAERWEFQPDINTLFAAAAAWRDRYDIAPAAASSTKIHVLGIDWNRDFTFPTGALYVGGRSGRGAIDDNDRFARFIYRNLGVITDVTLTLDTHLPFQIFFASFWVDAKGEALQPYRTITTAQIRAGEAMPNPAMAPWLANGNYAWLLKQVMFYCDELERAGKYQLYLWPFHCILGSDGHVLAGTIQEARLFFSFVRQAPALLEIKGGHLLTENYSVFSPEVLNRFDGEPLAQPNARFLKTLLQSDAVVIGGEAASHCVKSSIDDLLSEIKREAPSLVERVYLLEDCMSAVTVPDPAHPGKFLVDYTDEAQGALDRFRAEGMHVVKSTDPIESWPGLKIAGLAATA